MQCEKSWVTLNTDQAKCNFAYNCYVTSNLLSRDIPGMGPVDHLLYRTTFARSIIADINDPIGQSDFKDLPALLNVEKSYERTNGQTGTCLWILQMLWLLMKVSRVWPSGSINLEHFQCI